MKKILVCLVLMSAIFLASCSGSNDSTSSSSKLNSCGEPFLDENTTYKVIFETTKGDITITLDQKNAPVGASHLAYLADTGFYNDLTFHRVVPDFVIQGGDPKGDGTGSTKCVVRSEEPPKPYVQGDFAWAKSAAEQAGTAGSQFFIVTGKDTSQNVQFLGQKNVQADGSEKISYGYAGKVTAGLDVALAIEALAPPEGDGPPTEEVKITRAVLKS